MFGFILSTALGVSTFCGTMTDKRVKSTAKTIEQSGYSCTVITGKGAHCDSLTSDEVAFVTLFETSKECQEALKRIK